MKDPQDPVVEVAHSGISGNPGSPCSRLECNGDRVDREVPPSEILENACWIDLGQRARRVIRLGPSHRHVDGPTLRGHGGRPESPVNVDSTAQRFGKPRCNACRIAFDDEIRLVRDPTKQQVADGPSHEVDSVEVPIEGLEHSRRGGVRLDQFPEC